jgi:hypothetical protein
MHEELEFNQPEACLDVGVTTRELLDEAQTCGR